MARSMNQYLTNLRINNNLSIEALSNITKLSQDFLNNLEAGTITVNCRNADRIAKLVRYYNLDLDIFKRTFPKFKQFYISEIQPRKGYEIRENIALKAAKTNNVDVLVEMIENSEIRSAVIGEIKDLIVKKLKQANKDNMPIKAKLLLYLWRRRLYNKKSTHQYSEALINNIMNRMGIAV